MVNLLCLHISLNVYRIKTSKVSVTKQMDVSAFRARSPTQNLGGRGRGAFDLPS